VNQQIQILSFEGWQDFPGSCSWHETILVFMLDKHHDTLYPANRFRDLVYSSYDTICIISRLVSFKQIHLHINDQQCFHPETFLSLFNDFELIDPDRIPSSEIIDLAGFAIELGQTDFLLSIAADWEPAL
jgi:hypothetical protein